MSYNDTIELEEDNKLFNFLYYIFLSYFIIFGSFAITVTMSYILRIANKIDNDEVEFDEISYENSGYDELNELESIELNEEFMKDLCEKYLEKETPYGKIIMKYSEDFEGFIYYCDFTALYETLNATARYFVYEFNCKSLYNCEESSDVSDISEEETIVKSMSYDSLPDLNDNENEKENANEIESENASENASEKVFATLKNYQKKEENKNEPEKVINKFIKKGILDNFYKELNPPKEEHESKEISWFNFKNKSD